MHWKAFPIFLLLLLPSIAGCESRRHAKVREHDKRMYALADRYHAARSGIEKAATQRDVIATIDAAEREGILRNEVLYFASARLFAHLRLAKIAFDDGNAAVAHFHRAKAAEINREFSMGALGGIDLSSAAILAELARQVERLDNETK